MSWGDQFQAPQPLASCTRLKISLVHKFPPSLVDNQNLPISDYQGEFNKTCKLCRDCENVIRPKDIKIPTDRNPISHRIYRREKLLSRYCLYCLHCLAKQPANKQAMMYNINHLPTPHPGRTWLPNPSTSTPMIADSNQSNESFISQAPLPYHLPQDGSHFSQMPSNFTSPQMQFSAPAYQYSVGSSYNPSPLNPDVSSGYEKQGSYTYQMGLPGEGYQTAPQNFQGLGQGVAIQPHELQNGQIGSPMTSLGYSYHPPSNSPIPQYFQHYATGQGEFMSPQSPYSMQQYPASNQQAPSLHPQIFQGPHETYRSNNGGQYQHLSNQGPPVPPGGSFQSYNSRHSGNGSMSAQAYGSEYGAEDQPSYKSSGFVPANHHQNQRYGSREFHGQHPRQSRRSYSPHFRTQNHTQNKAWGRQYRHGNAAQTQQRDSSLAHVSDPAQKPIYVLSTQQSISPRTVPEPARGSQFLHPASVSPPSKGKDNEVQTPAGAGTQVIQSTTPTTVSQLMQSPTPLLRSRKGQSVSTLKIDPIRGPPPAFWPGGDQGPVAISTSSPTKPLIPARLESFIPGGHGPDPFTSTSLVNSSTPAVFMSPPQEVQNPFADTQRTATVLAPLVIPQQSSGRPSRHLASIAPNCVPPSIEVALDANNLPFVETARLTGPAHHGVVKIANIPYGVTRSEIIAFLGRNARILNDDDEPVHIMMERVTSKTMDAYIEFISMDEAVQAVSRHEKSRMCGRTGRLGERHVDLEVSSQDRLMKDLFPKARNVRWTGGRPEILPTDPNDCYNSGFKGFLSNEELVMLVKHVEAPQRSPFAKECPQRPYECLISTLMKYPWYMVDSITLEDRDKLVETTRKLVQFLICRINSGMDENLSINVNDRLLRRVRTAAFRCPGFSVSQKDDIAFLCGLDYSNSGLAPFADHWHVFKTIGPRPNVNEDVLVYYIALLRESSISAEIVPLAERSVKQTLGNHAFFGDISIDYPDNVMKMSLGQIAKIEWNVIEGLLRQKLRE